MKFEVCFRFKTKYVQNFWMNHEMLLILKPLYMMFVSIPLLMPSIYHVVMVRENLMLSKGIEVFYCFIFKYFVVWKSFCNLLLALCGFFTSCSDDSDFDRNSEEMNSISDDEFFAQLEVLDLMFYDSNETILVPNGQCNLKH